MWEARAAPRTGFPPLVCKINTTTGPGSPCTRTKRCPWGQKRWGGRKDGVLLHHRGRSIGNRPSCWWPRWKPDRRVRWRRSWLFPWETDHSLTERQETISLNHAIAAAHPGLALHGLGTTLIHLRDIREDSMQRLSSNSLSLYRAEVMHLARVWWWSISFVKLCWKAAWTTHNNCSQPRKEPCFCSSQWIREQINSLYTQILYTYKSEPLLQLFCLFVWIFIEITSCIFYLLVHV